MSKIVVLLAEGFEEVEALSPVDYLRRAGQEVLTLATGTNERTVTGSHRIPVVADKTLKDFLEESKGSLPDAVIIPGGMPGSVNVSETKEALSLIDSMEEKGKLICAICAAPAVVLSKTKALGEKKWSCYPGMEDRAGDYIRNHQKDVRFVHDKNLITGTGPGAAEEFSMEIVKTLCGEETASKVKKAANQR